MAATRQQPLARAPHKSTSQVRPLLQGLWQRSYRSGDDLQCHIMAVVQLRHRNRQGRAAGKTPREAVRCLKRRLSDLVYHQMILDARTRAAGRRRAHSASDHPAAQEE